MMVVQGSTCLATRLNLGCQQLQWPHSYFRGLHGPCKYRGHRGHLLFRSLPPYLENRNLDTSRLTPIAPGVQAGKMPLEDTQEIPVLIQRSHRQRSTKRKKPTTPRILPHNHAHLTTPPLQHPLHLHRNLQNPLHHPKRQILQVA